MRQKFNPKDWLPKNEGEEQQSSNNVPLSQPSNHSSMQPSDISDDIDLIVSRIESAHIDITGHYYDWRNLGFALTDELGESGRDYFHRICRFYPKYSQGDCNRLYDQCLKSQGHGITIKTLFHMAKQAGIEIGRLGEDEKVRKGEDEKVRGGENENSTPQASGTEPSGLPSPDSGVPELPTFPDSVFEYLPEFFKKVVARCHTNEQRDIMLLGSMATLSACLPKVYGYYDETRVYANLFLFIVAQASAGKGRLVLCKRLVNAVHWALRQETQAMKAAYEIEMMEYNLLKGKDFGIEKPVKPPEKMLFIPANNSTTGVFQLLSDNDGKGLIFETEGDTLAQAFKTDYGNYSDGFRKAFHHESISYYRRTDREFVEIDNPCMSTVLSSTPKQVATLIPNAENGLLSRFIFYHMNIKPVWKNVFPPRKGKDLEVYFDELGQEFFQLYKALEEHPAIEFFLTEEQKDQFHAFFTQVQDKYLMLQGMDYMATIRRLGLIAFRLAMVLNTLRIMETGDFSEKQECSDVDFQTVLSMIRVLVKHSSHVFSELPVEAKPVKPKDKKEQFLDILPGKFTRQEFVKLAKSIGLTEKTALGYIANFCTKGLILHQQHDCYINPNAQEAKDETHEESEGEQ